jgi:hypothetical protein
MDSPHVNLKEYGIDVGLLISGLFGAILLTSKQAAMNLTRTVSSLVGGAASANYITPLVVSFAKLDDTHYHYGIAFLLGFLGLKGIEYFSSKILPDDVNITHHNIKTSTSCDASLVVDTPIEDSNNDLKVKKVRKLRVRK